MKNLKKVLALVLAVVMIMGTVAVASAKDYADVKADSDYAEAIDVLSNLNILDGFKNGETYNFQPDGYFTRAQAAKIVAIVHNAATNGKIKGQDAISSLYSNAQNPFVDCNNSWALPFINYCRITGLADGMTKTTYAPERRLTGVQWLKLMLTTLNFDTAKEGYTGTGWDINVLNRANEIGLTAGLADGWKAIAPIKRGEAAQVLYNALTAYLVEYGQLVKGFQQSDAAVFNAAFVSNEQVAKSGFMLGEKMGIAIERATDAFRRPGYNWSYGSWSAFYMDKPVNSYTTAVSACDILKNDMKVPETSSKVIHLNGHRKGITEGTTVDTTKASKLKVDGAAAAYTALNYYAVDGFKYVNNLQNGGVDEVTLNHTRTKSCQNIEKIGNHWSLHKFGGNGDLTQVFKTEDGWVITTIHTFLGEVKTLDKSNKYSHAKTETGTAQLWVRTTDDVPTYGNEETTALKTISTVDYAVGTRVLATVSFKNTEAANLTGSYYGATKTDAYIVDVAAAEAKNGKLTGASDLAYAESVSIDGTKYPAACRFVMGKDKAMKIGNNGNAFTFYFDSYGNVIGCDDLQTTSEYVVLDAIWGSHEDGKFVIRANMYDLSGKAIEKAVVSSKAGSFKNVVKGTNTTPFLNSLQLDDIAKNNDANLTDALYTYTVDDKGVYTLTYAGIDFYAGYPAGWSRLDAAGQGTLFTHKAKTAYIAGNEYSGERRVVNISESTKFICKGTDGTWKTFTGYTELPALSAQFVDYTYEAGSTTFAAVVYLGEVSYAGDAITGFVTSWKAFDWANGYDLITVYVDGEPVVVNVEHAPNVNNAIGMWTFETKVDENGVTYSAVYALRDGEVLPTNVKAVVVSNDGTAVTLETQEGAVGLTNPAIYRVLKNGTLVKAEAKDIFAGDQIILYKAAAGQPYTALYIIDQM